MNFKGLKLQLIRAWFIFKLSMLNNIPTYIKLARFLKFLIFFMIFNDIYKSMSKNFFQNSTCPTWFMSTKMTMYLFIFILNIKSSFLLLWLKCSNIINILFVVPYTVQKKTSAHRNCRYTNLYMVNLMVKGSWQYLTFGGENLPPSCTDLI